MKRIVELVLVLATLAPSTAWAGKAAVAPLVPDGVKDEVAVNVTNLVAMELDFMGAFDSVQQMDPRPAGLDKACVTSASCLARIQKLAGTDALVAGVLTGAGKNVTVQLAYLEQGKLVRAKAFTAEGTSSVLADRMGGWMEELIKGVSQEQRAKASDLGNLDVLSASEIMAADDLEDEAADQPRVVGKKGGPIPTLQSRESAEDLTAPLTPAEEKAEAARKAAEAQAIADAAALAAKRAAEDAQAAKREAAVANGQTPVESWEDITFAPASDIQVDAIVFESATSFIQVEGAEETAGAALAAAGVASASKSKSKSDKKAKLAGESGTREDANEAYASIEKAQQPPKSKRVDYAAINAPPPKGEDLDSRSRVDKQKDDDGPALVGIGAGVGFTQFQSLSFVTYGGEIVLRPMTHVAFVGGAHAYSVHRDIPAELVASGEPTTTWNTIFPINLGAQYRPRVAQLEPYVGAEGILIPGYVRASADQDTGSNLAGGGRVRGGIDYKLNPTLALNADLAVAYLSGENFQYVEDGMKKAGVAPQISVGTVFLF